MPKAQRQGDPNAAGGAITSGISSVRFNNRPAAVPGRSVTAHPCCGRRRCGKHCSAITKGGSPNVRAGNLPVLRTGTDSDTCGHPRAVGSPNVRVN